MMRRNAGNTMAALAVIVLPHASNAQSSPAAVPFVVGEELTYKASYGRIPAGTARMSPAWTLDVLEHPRTRYCTFELFICYNVVPADGLPPLPQETRS